MEARTKDEFLANGIQILGKEEVKKIVIGVSMSYELLQKAVDVHADMVLCKHPMRIEAVNQVLTPSLQKRLSIVFKNNLTVGGYHYPLDVHPEVGNTPLAFKELSIKPMGRIHNGWGYYGELEKEIDQQEFVKKLSKVFHHNVFPVLSDKKVIKRIGMVSGGGIPHTEDLQEMLDLKLDAYITGEISEWTVHLFKESNIAYFSCGHHATEVLGPQAFSKTLQTLLGKNVFVEFINIWNEI